jgi:hypothetical protein
MMEIAKTCTHIKLDGGTCRMLALKDRRFCHYHEHYHQRRTAKPKEEPFTLLPFEDTRSILYTIHNLMHDYLNDTLDEKKFGNSIYALQVAAQYANRRDALAPDALAALEQHEREQSSAAESPDTAKPQFSLADLLAETLEIHDVMAKEELANPEAAKKDHSSRFYEIQERKRSKM